MLDRCIRGELTRKEKLALIKMFVRGVLHNEVRSLIISDKRKYGFDGNSFGYRPTGIKEISFRLEPSADQEMEEKMLKTPCECGGRGCSTCIGCLGCGELGCICWN